MAEVLATFSALSSVLQLIDFTAKIVKHASDIASESRHLPGEDRATERLALEYRDLNRRIRLAIPDNQLLRTEDEDALLRQQVDYDLEAERLLKQLGALKAEPGLTGPKRLQDVARKALRAARKRKELDKHRVRLQELNGCLGTTVLQILMSRHENLIEQMLSLRQDMQSLRDEQKVQRMDNGLREVHRHVLKCLLFPGMRARVDHIDPQYPKTYEWAVREDAFGLRTWLKSGNGIFWISGKAGAGKSTLVKFLSHNAEAKRLLREWAVVPFVQASFYFWFQGSPEQKTIRGLVRSILHDIISQAPKNGAMAFPDLYNAILPPDTHTTWTDVELLDGFRKLTKHADRPLCLFIDGLDEFRGEQIELIRLLRDISGNPLVKLCVSSRPWNAFRSAFESRAPNIRLEELSLPDIKYFVECSIRNGFRDMYDLQEHDDTEDVQSTDFEAEENDDIDDFENSIYELVNSITSRAEGVFLWVKLVVQSVLNGLAEGDPLHMLKHRVMSFPADLYEFFENILDRVEGIYKNQTHQALKLACVLVELKHGEAISPNLSFWLDYWLISRDVEGLQNAGDIVGIQPQYVSSKKVSAMIEQTRKFLSASCKDLLCLPRSCTHERPFVKVEFLHRSVYEFLSEAQQDYRGLINGNTPDIYHSDRIVHLLNLARLKFLFKDEGDEVQRERMARVEETAVRSLGKMHVDLNQKYIDQFDEVLIFYLIKLGGPTTLISSRPRFLSLVNFVPTSACLVASRNQKSVSDLLESWTDAYPGRYIYNDFDLKAAYIGLDTALGQGEYWWPKIDELHRPIIEAFLKMPQILEEINHFWVSFIHTWILSSPLTDLRQSWEMAKLFISNGATVHKQFVPLLRIEDKPKSGSNGKAPLNDDVFLLLKSQLPSDWLAQVADRCPCLAHADHDHPCCTCDRSHWRYVGYFATDIWKQKENRSRKKRVENADQGSDNSEDNQDGPQGRGFNKLRIDDDRIKSWLRRKSFRDWVD